MRQRNICCFFCPQAAPMAVKIWRLVRSIIKTVVIAQCENECISLSVPSLVRAQFTTVAKHFKGSFPNRPYTRGEEMRAAKSPQVHWIVTRNMNQYSFISPQVPPFQPSHRFIKNSPYYIVLGDGYIWMIANHYYETNKCSDCS